MNEVDIKSMDDHQLSTCIKENELSLKKEEARKIVTLLGRNPSLTELHIFNIQWSEHSSYKSSRAVLKQLPTKASNVILGPVEDSGIVTLGEHDGHNYGIVVSHESHNHPSQVVPYEGAATGVGGIMRDVLCMGAHIIATADPLRFGNPEGPSKNKVRYIASEVINGIAGYGNAVGVPNIGGDIAFSSSFDENCLVNVVCLGLVKEQDIIHSYAPAGAEGYDIVIVGKATDNSGFGGAAFASIVLDEEQRESNRGAVQVPDPFLKNMLIRATHEVFKRAKSEQVTLGFKDMGAGGMMCATTELCSDAGFGAVIDLDNVPVAFEDLPPYVIAASETQERFAWICPPEFSQTILEVYNKEFELPSVSPGACAQIIGKVTKEKNYVLKHKGQEVCNAPIEVITKGISYQRPSSAPSKKLMEPTLDPNRDLVKDILGVLAHPNVASKMACYKHYDTSVLGQTVIASGQADAGVLAPLENSYLGIALKTDGNPRYNRIDPYWGAVNAVAESMRNVVAVGSRPAALTDCLNYGNPEDPEQFHHFSQGVKGIADAATHISQSNGEPVAVISGNVSFYNESATGVAIDPSPIVACVGVLSDVRKAITMKIKQEQSVLILVGERKNELGGSIYYDCLGHLGKNLPLIDFDQEKKQLYSVLAAIEKGLVLSCHDISEGGLITTVSEMILGGEADGAIGASLTVDESSSLIELLFSESSGFVLEVSSENQVQVMNLFSSKDIHAQKIGETTNRQQLSINQGKNKMSIAIDDLQKAWTTGFTKVLK